MKLEEVERELGFRVAPHGVEILVFDDKGAISVKAVQPNLHKDAAQKLWHMMVAHLRESDMRKREKEAWADRAFRDHERAEELQKQLDKLKSQGQTIES